MHYKFSHIISKSIVFHSLFGTNKNGTISKHFRALSSSAKCKCSGGSLSLYVGANFNECSHALLYWKQPVTLINVERRSFFYILKPIMPGIPIEAACVKL